MGKDPAILFYTADFLVGTSLMTNEQVGMYIKILCHQHQIGRLTEKEIKIICGSLDDYVLSKFTQDKNGNFFNKRMEEEAEKRQNYSKSRSENRRKGLKNKEKLKETYEKDMKDICGTHDTSYENHMENENVNENEDVNRVKKSNKFIPPTVDLITEYCIQRNNKVDANYFWDYYQTRGWKVGKATMKDWKACVRTWENNDYNIPKGNPKKDNKQALYDLIESGVLDE